MNLSDASFLCLDIGSAAVHGFGARVRGGRISESALEVRAISGDATDAIKSLVDALTTKIGRNFDSAHITGTFTNPEFSVISKSAEFDTVRTITSREVWNITSDLSDARHIVPLRWDTDSEQNLTSPLGRSAKTLRGLFAVLRFDDSDVRAAMRAAHLFSDSVADASFLVAGNARERDTRALLIDMGAGGTTVSVWIPRGPVFMRRIPLGQIWVTKRISEILHTTPAIADRLKIKFASQTQTDNDRFTPADASSEFSRADIFDAIDMATTELMSMVYDAVSDTAAHHRVEKIYIFGGGANIATAAKITGDMFLLPTENLGPFAAVNAVAANFWNENMPRIKKYITGRQNRDARISKLKIFAPKKRKRIIPIMPSTQNFDMTSDVTYRMFADAGITKIHCDIMDGFYVDNVVGGIGWLKRIRGKTNMKLHVHLMSENPSQWTADAIAAGADEIILSSGVAGLRDAITVAKKSKIPVGIALHPNAKIEILGPVLRDIDEVLIMSVMPGTSGAEFLPDALKKIRALANTRKKYGLKFKISVDGGINADTAKLCWVAGADWLVSGTYLARAPDFAMAVQSLLPGRVHR